MSDVEATSTMDPAHTTGWVICRLEDPQFAFPHHIDVSTARLSVAPYAVNRGDLLTGWSLALQPFAGAAVQNEMPTTLCAVATKDTAVFDGATAPSDSSVWYACNEGIAGTLQFTGGYVEEVVADAIYDENGRMFMAAVLSPSFEAVGGLDPYVEQGVHIAMLGRFGTSDPSGPLLSVQVLDIGSLSVTIISNKAMLNFEYLDGAPSMVRSISMPIDPMSATFIGLSVDHWQAQVMVRTGTDSHTSAIYPFTPETIYPTGFKIGGEGSPRFLTAAVLAGPASKLHRSFAVSAEVIK